VSLYRLPILRCPLDVFFESDTFSLFDQTMKFVAVAGLRNCKFITGKLWGFCNQAGAFMHMANFAMVSEAVQAHHGEGLSGKEGSRRTRAGAAKRFIGFLKSLQI